MFVTSVMLAFRQIRRHVTRSFLTVLGVVIGVFSVITMVTLGDGATASVREQISALGSDLLQIRPGQNRGPGGGGAGQVTQAFRMSDIEAIREQIGGVTSVAPTTQTAGLAVRNAENWSTSITGTTNAYFEAFKLQLERGRTFNTVEEQSGRSVCVIGATIVENLFRGTEPLGQSLRVKGVSCEVIGVLVERGQSGFGNDQDDTIVMPIKAVQRQMIGNQDVTGLAVGVDPTYDSSGIQKSLTSLLRERRLLQAAEDNDFTIIDAKQISDTVSGTVGILTMLVGAVAGISLLVGGIGIMNIMLVSVTERTREIGIRLAIGALGSEVQQQFLVEAVVLSSLGGLIGIGLAFLIGSLAAPALGLPFLFNPGINFLSFAFSAIIGVVFGYFPARRAAALDPIEALRYD